MARIPGLVLRLAIGVVKRWPWAARDIGGEEYAPFLFGGDGVVKDEFRALDEPLGLRRFLDPHISSAPIRLSADPSVAWDASWKKTNWMTTEFSLLYRWHSLVPDEVAWNGALVPVHETFMDNRHLTTGGLKAAFAGMSAQPAGRLGAFNTTEHLLPLEVAAVEQGRRVRLAPYGDYRAYVGEVRPKAFSDISCDPDVVEFLASSYRRAEDVDFYVGLFAEDPVKNSPLPPLLLAMVAVDAFSQALTNPLLSKHVLRDPVATFSEQGWSAIEATGSLRDVLDRNCPGGVGRTRVSMTQEGWRYAW